MSFLVNTAEPVQMGHQPVKEIDADSTGKYADDGDEQAPVSAVIQGGQDQAQYRRRQHHAGSKGQHNITEPVGYFLEYKAQERAEDRGPAYTQSCLHYKLLMYILLTVSLLPS